MGTLTADREHWLPRALLAALLLLYCIMIVRTAWVSDDAYFTFRTVANWVGGHGLRWNIDERVQAYTNPLWMLAVTGIYRFTGEFYFSSLALSGAFSLLAILALVRLFQRQAAELCLALLCLVFSKAFMDYTSSGLENPLSYLLVVLFAWAWFGRQPLMVLALIAALLGLNRLDSLLLTLPALTSRLGENGPGPAMRSLAAGFSPLLAWLAFAMVYYGTPFPNTAYAKLNTGMDRQDLLVQGGRYMLDSLDRDPLSLMVITAAILFPLVRRNRELLPLSLGLLAVLAYTLYIGGDFMSGRWFSVPVLMAVCILLRFAQLGARVPVRIMISALVILPLLAGGHPFRAGADQADRFVSRHGIADERSYWYPQSGLLIYFQQDPARRDRHFANIGDSGIRRGENMQMGTIAYMLGPDYHVVDFYALADPFLARLTPQPGQRIGHMVRHIPPGYVESLKSGAPRIEDPGLRQLYDKVVLVTRGDYFDPRRWGAIFSLLFDGTPRRPASGPSAPVRELIFFPAASAAGARGGQK